MDRVNSSFVGIPSRANYQQTVQRAKQNFTENSGEIAAGGAVGTATFAAFKNSSQIGKKAVALVQESKVIQATKKAQIINIFQRFKFLNSPVVKKLAGPLAGFAALSSVAGSAAKIADTCQYLNAQNNN